MCCLGQVGEQLGATREHLLLSGTPADVDPLAVEPLDLSLAEALCEFTVEYENTALSNAAMDINDNKDLSDAEREAQLTKLFAENGHEIEFVGEFK